jgi:superfamily I DNA/RNA helicase
MLGSMEAALAGEGDPAVRFSESTAAALRALAGPGTGKTYALVRRLAYLLEEGPELRPAIS